MDAGTSIFVAYPSRPLWLADGTHQLAQELRKHWETSDWASPLEPGTIWASVQSGLDDSDLLLAQLTRPNSNVYFELGYMIARGKAVFGLLDRNYEDDADIPPLEPVAHIQYENRRDVADYLATISLSSPSLSDQIGIRNAYSTPGRLHFIPARGGGDRIDSALNVCRESVFDVGWADPGDPEYDSLRAQAQAIAEADLVVGLLVNEEVKNADIRNAQVMLYAGIAAGLGRQLVVFAHQPLRRLLDLGDQLVPFHQEAELAAKLKRYLAAAIRARVSTPTPQPARRIAPPSGPIADLFLGNLDARADAHLNEYFVRIPEFAQVRRGERHLIVGSKGSGKTALYEMVRREFDGQRKALIEIAPSNFEFPRLAGILQEVSEAHWEFVFGSFWRFILLTEIVREIQANFDDFLLTHTSRMTGNRTQDNWADTLDEWLGENRALLELDFVSRVASVLTSLEAVPGGEEERRAACEDMLQVARMYDVERALFSFSREFEIRLLVDDLDRNWAPSSEPANRMLISLLTAVHDLMDRFVRNNGEFYPALFVRRDVYDWLRRHDAEITRRDPAHLLWTPESLERLIATRIAVRADRNETETNELWNLIFPIQVGEETSAQFVISRTHKRPRDVLRFCQAAVDRALRAGRAEVSDADLRASWEEAGQLALAQTEKEYEVEYPGLGAVALFFFDKPIAHRWPTVAPDLALYASEQGGANWLRRGLDDPEALLEVLYSTEIVGLESSSGLVIYATERPFSEIRPALGHDFMIHVHPAYRKYLQCLGNWDARAAVPDADA